MHAILFYIVLFGFGGLAGLLAWACIAERVVRGKANDEMESAVGILIGFPISFFVGGGLAIAVWIFTA